MKLKKEVQEKLLKNRAFRQALAEQRGTDTPNVVRLLKKNSELLTTISAFKLIRLHTGLTQTQIYEE